MQQCKTCGKSGHWQRCTGCKVVFYCSTKCQKAHWKQHKKKCKAFRAEVDASGKDKTALSAEGRFRRGTRYLSKGRFKKAEVEYRKAILIDPEDALAHHSLGNALHAMGDQDGAIASFKRAISTDPNHTNAHCNLGNALKNKGDLESAITSYKQAISIDPNNVDARESLAAAYRAKHAKGLASRAS